MTVSVVQAQDEVWRVDEVAAPVAFTLETNVLPFFPRVDSFAPAHLAQVAWVAADF